MRIPWPPSTCGLVAAALVVIANFSLAAPQPKSDPAPKASTTQPTPSPDLKPQDVVKAVIDALKKNDDKDTGIKTTWLFASPANKEATGPIDRFIPMVKTPAYAPMLNHKSAAYGDIVVLDDEAEEMVALTDAAGDKTYYVFRLSRQKDGPLKGCWMTDGVVRVQPADAPEKPPEKTVKKPDKALPA